MKNFIFFFAFLFLTPTTFAQSNQELRDYVDHLLAAISFYSPDPVMASALGAAPEAIRIGLVRKCNTQMESVEIELMENLYTQKRYHELLELSAKAEAIKSALTGDPKPLLEFNKDKEKKMKEREEERKKKLREENKLHMEISLDLLQDELDRLKASADEIKDKGNANLKSARSKLNEVLIYLEYNKKKDDMEVVYSAFVEEGKSICDEAQKSQDKISELHTVLKDGEKIIKSRIDQANESFANCANIQDALFVKDKYQESKQALAILKKGKEGTVENFFDILKRLTDIEKINKSIDSLNYYIKELSPKLSKGNSKINKLLEEVDKNIDQLESGFSKPDILNKELDAFKLRIEGTKQDYIKDFPKSEVKFNELISKTNAIYIKSFVLDHLGLSDLREKHRKYQNAKQNYLSRSIFSRKGKFKTKSPIKCLSIDEAQKKMNKIEEIYFWALLTIKDNEHLKDGCVPIVTDSTQEDSSQNPDITNIPPPPIPNVSIDSTSTNTSTPEKSVFGGLTIGGSSEITVGSVGQFIALDGAGDPYPNQGGFTWINTREDLLVLSSSSGVTTGGTAFRAGSATIILKFDGFRDYKDVKIKAKKGDESNDDISEGGLNEDNTLKEKCRNLIDRITISLNSSNIENARIFTNRALALGCDVNADAVNTLIAQIEAKMEEEQKLWEQKYAQQEKERQIEADRIKAERKKTRNENLNTFVGLLGEKINEVNNLNEQRRQERDDKKKSDFEKSQEKINQILSNTSKPPLNNPDKVGFITEGTPEFMEMLNKSNKKSQNTTIDIQDGDSNNQSTNSSSDEKPVYMGVWKVTHKCIQDDGNEAVSKKSKVGESMVIDWEVGNIYDSKLVGYIRTDSRFIHIDIRLIKGPLPQGEVKFTQEFDKLRTTRYHIAKRKIEITINKNSFYGSITDYRKFYYTGGDAGVIKWTLKGVKK